MNLNLNCSQVLSLIKFYVEGKLNPILEKSVSAHLSSCKDCRQIANELKNSLFPPDTQDQNPEKLKTDDNIFVKNLSAYIDNELSTNDNIKIKKIAISNPNAREKLEKMYKFQKLMHSAYQKTKNELKTDFSKNVVGILTDSTEEYTRNYLKIIILFLIIMICVILGSLYLYF